MEKLTVDSLKLKINDKTILDNISFKLDKNETLIIIGESGSGKSVCSRLLTGIIPYGGVIEGSIYFNEENLLNISEKKRKKYRGKKIAYITQNPMSAFNDFQNISSHVIELFQSHFKLSKQECINKMLSGVKKLNFSNPEEIMKKYPFQLSGGMLQRIMCAMMMELEPDILIADEPTSALDYNNTEKIAEMLKNYRNKENILIVVTHDYDLAEELGGKMIIMKKGVIIEEGKTSEVLKNPQSDYGKELLLKKTYIRKKKRI